MELIDFIKQIFHTADKHLKRRHFAVVALAFLLLYIGDDNSSPEDLIAENQEFDAAQSNPAAPQEIETEIAALPEALQLSDFIIPLDPEGIDQEAITTQAEPRYVTEVKSGDNLSLIFTRAGLSAQDVYNISNSGEEASILSRLYPGYTLSFDISSDGTLNELEVFKSPLESFVFTLNSEADFDIEHNMRTPSVEQSYKEASIQDSLFLAAQRGGISDPITMEIAGIFGGVIDFLLDTRTGDTFNVLYEEEYLSGEFIGNGSILATQFTNQGETFTALRYENAAGEVGYFNPEGESMRKAFLRNPIDYVRISDGFNPSRRHPILNTIRAHKGTDYAAPRGTPVVATSDGRVTWAARNGSFGKLVVIQHGERFQTKYAHLADYARGVQNGARVTQGQIIGYVGTTGGSTGPHLHYEFLMDGVHRNSRTIHDRLPKAESIAADEMQRFHEQTNTLLARLALYNQDNQTPNTSIAQNTVTPD